MQSWRPHPTPASVPAEHKWLGGCQSSLSTLAQEQGWMLPCLFYKGVLQQTGTLVWNSTAVWRGNSTALTVPLAAPFLSVPISCLTHTQFAHSRAHARSFLSSLPPAVSRRQVKVTVWHGFFCIIYLVEDRVRHLEENLRSHPKWILPNGAQQHNQPSRKQTWTASWREAAFGKGCCASIWPRYLATPQFCLWFHLPNFFSFLSKHSLKWVQSSLFYFFLFFPLQNEGVFQYCMYYI